MAKKNNYLDEELSQRIDSLTDWLERLSTPDERSSVVNDKTATEFVRNTLEKDSSLSNLVKGIDETGSGMKSFLNSSYIKSLIDANKAGEKLDVAVGKARKARLSLEKELPKKTAKDRKLRSAVVNRYMTPNISKKYDIYRSVNKKGIIQYRDSKGRFTSKDKILKVTDKVIATSKSRRADYDKFIASWKKRNNYVGKP